MNPAMHRTPARLAGLAALGAAAGLMAVVMVGCTTAPAPSADDLARYAAVVANPIRTDQDRRMDESRRPAELLAFAMVKPGMQVLDVAAGGGFTSQVLTLAVGPTGRVWAQAQRPGPVLTQRLADHPQANLILVQQPLEDPIPAQAPPLDLITIILNYHDITFLPVDRPKMNGRLLAALKPGGRLVVVDHSGRSGTGISEARTLHRIEESVVVAELRQAGFVLEAKGDFLRNPADPRDESSNNPKVPTDKFALRFVKAP